jgi:adenylate cyclase
MTTDFEREGLLEDLPDEEARAARRELLERLAADGVSLEDLRRAVHESRLVLLPAERALSGSERYTVEEVAERSGVELELLLAEQQALGAPRPEPDDRVLSDDDLEAARGLRRLLDAGLPAEGLLDVARVLGQAMENLAAASGLLVGEALLSPGDSELEVARRYAGAAEELTPVIASLLDHQYRLKLREGMRRATIGRQVLESGELAAAVEVSVGFADLVGFTRLGERLPASDLGRLAGRLAAMAAERASPPVRLVKTIGDAAMLSSPESEPLLDALLGLVDDADAAGEDFPQLRAGAARGPALPRGGDWYGRPVNLASRITGAARPGSVLAASELRDDAPDRYRWSRAPARHFKGIHGRVRLYRVRPASEEEGGEEPAG